MEQKTCPFFWRLFSPFENPFLLLHLHRHSHKLPQRLAVLFVALTTMTLPLLIAAVVHLFATLADSAPRFAGLSLGEWAAAGIAWTQLGWMLLWQPMVKGTFAYEKRLGALDFVLLTPHKPHELILFRAMAPFADCILLTLFSLPLYALCLVFGGIKLLSLLALIVGLVLLTACNSVFYVLGNELRYLNYQRFLGKQTPQARVMMPEWVWWVLVPFFWVGGIMFSFMPQLPDCPSWFPPRPLPLMMHFCNWLVTPTKFFFVPMIPVLVIFPLLICSILAESFKCGALLSDRDEDFERAQRWRSRVGAAWMLTLLGFFWDSHIATGILPSFGLVKSAPLQEALQGFLILLMLWEGRICLLPRLLGSDRFEQWAIGMTDDEWRVTSDERHPSPFTRLFWYWSGGYVRALAYFAVGCLLSGTSPFIVGFPFLGCLIWVALCDAALMIGLTLSIRQGEKMCGQSAMPAPLQGIFLWMMAFLMLPMLPKWIQAFHPGLALISLSPFAAKVPKFDLPDLSLTLRLLLPALFAAWSLKQSRRELTEAEVKRLRKRMALFAPHPWHRYELSRWDEWLLSKWDNPVFQFQLRRAARRHGQSYFSAGCTLGVWLVVAPPFFLLAGMMIWMASSSLPRSSLDFRLQDIYLIYQALSLVLLPLIPFFQATVTPVQNVYFERDSGFREDLLKTLLTPKDLILGWTGVNGWLCLQLAAPLWLACLLVTPFTGRWEALIGSLLLPPAFLLALFDAVLLASVLSWRCKGQDGAMLSLIMAGFVVMLAGLIPGLHILAASSKVGQPNVMALPIALLAMNAVLALALPFLWDKALQVMERWRKAYDDEQPQRFKAGV